MVRIGARVLDQGNDLVGDQFLLMCIWFRISPFLYIPGKVISFQHKKPDFKTVYLGFGVPGLLCDCAQLRWCGQPSDFMSEKICVLTV